MTAHLWGGQMNTHCDSAFYRARGERAYEIGIIRFVASAPKAWQRASERRGWADAQAAWCALNPNADEWGAAAERAKQCKAQS